MISQTWGSLAEASDITGYWHDLGRSAGDMSTLLEQTVLSLVMSSGSVLQEWYVQDCAT